ncbi:MAG: hypothetical protein O2905_05210, partial [Proteobacteria bacterium]|nr:hypothetical protein [Pseudomonadota bacterium]
HLAAAAAAAGDVGRAEAEYAEAGEWFAAAAIPIGAVLTALGRAELAARTSDNDAAADLRAAAAALAAIDDPVAEANRFLGLPPVGQIVLLNEINQGFGGDEPDPAAILRAAAERKENLAAHPNHNLEGKRLVAEIVERIAAAQTAN